MDGRAWAEPLDSASLSVERPSAGRQRDPGPWGREQHGPRICASRFATDWHAQRLTDGYNARLAVPVFSTRRTGAAAGVPSSRELAMLLTIFANGRITKPDGVHGRLTRVPPATCARPWPRAAATTWSAMPKQAEAVPQALRRPWRLASCAVVRHGGAGVLAQRDALRPPELRRGLAAMMPRSASPPACAAFHCVEQGKRRNFSMRLAAPDAASRPLGRRCAASTASDSRSPSRDPSGNVGDSRPPSPPARLPLPVTLQGETFPRCAAASPPQAPRRRCRLRLRGSTQGE